MKLYEAPDIYIVDMTVNERIGACKDGEGLWRTPRDYGIDNNIVTTVICEQINPSLS